MIDRLCVCYVPGCVQVFECMLSCLGVRSVHACVCVVASD